MEPRYKTEARVDARDKALGLLQRLTVGASLAAVAGVGLLGAVSAATIPGTSASSTTNASTSANASPSTSNSSNASSAAGTIEPSSGVSTSSGTGVAVTGGS